MNQEASNKGKLRNPSFGGAWGGGLRWLAVLMGITILGITGFQLYWLMENYKRENKTLAINSENTFRKAIQQLQVSKLKLDEIPGDSSGKGNK